MNCKERLGLLQETQNNENLIYHKVSLQKTRVIKSILGKLIRRRELELVRGPFSDWYEQIFVVPMAQRFDIPAVDRTLQDCQQLLYLHNQHKTVLKSKLKTMHRQTDENEAAEVVHLRKEREHWEAELERSTRDLQTANAEFDNLYRHLKRLEAECQRLIQGGVEVVQYEEEYIDERRLSRLR